MLVEINIPDIGTDEFEVTDILVKIGDSIEIDQTLIVIEGKKVSLEIPSPEFGVVKNIKISIGDKISTGNLIMIIEKKNNIINNDIQNISILDFKKKNTQISDSSITTIKKIFLPNIGDIKLKIIDIMVNIGTNVINNTSLIKLKSNNMLIEIITPYSGIIKDINVKINDVIESKSLIMIIEIQSSYLVDNENYNIITKVKNINDHLVNDNNINYEKNNFDKNIKHIHATPLIRRLARKFGINLDNIRGTGFKNRILREDIQEYIKNIIHDSQIKNNTKHSNFLNVKPLPQIDYSEFGLFEEIELSNTQKLTSTNLSRNWITIPHVTIMEDIDITELENFRKQQNNEIKNFQSENIKITILVFIMKAIAYTLKEMPNFNSSISLDYTKLIVKKYINIGIAVDTINGLIVPVIRDVNKKNILELSRELILLTQKARLGKLTITELQGGSFTISNLGNIGTVNFTPIINAPEVAIIGISRSLIKPIWNDNKFVPRLILPISLSFDHRVINGADAARFITRISNLMSDIRRLIM